MDEATRQYFSWHAWNALELDARDIAIQFGHQDGGELVRKLYEHPDAARARERVREALLRGGGPVSEMTVRAASRCRCLSPRSMSNRPGDFSR